MPDITLHDIPEHIFAQHAQQALAEGVDLDRHFHLVLSRALPTRKEQALERIAQLRKEIFAKHGMLDDSAPLIREFRDTL